MKNHLGIQWRGILLGYNQTECNSTSLLWEVFYIINEARVAKAVKMAVV